MTQVLVVVLGQAGAALQQAIRPGAPLGGSHHIALRRLPCEADAVAGMALPSSPAA